MKKQVFSTSPVPLLAPAGAGATALMLGISPPKSYGHNNTYNLEYFAKFSNPLL